MVDERPRARGPRAAKKVGPLTQGALRFAALRYVERYPATVVSLTRTLRRKVQTWERKTDEPAPVDAPAWIAAIVEEVVTRGFVDDRRLAEAKTASLQRKGKSKRAVQATLRAKGVGETLIDEVIAASGGSDEEAAWILAKKKRLGPYREASERREKRDKDMAVLGRAGFSFWLARTIVESESPR